MFRVSKNARLSETETVSFDEGNTFVMSKMSQGGNAALLDNNSDLHDNTLAGTAIRTERPLAMGTGSIKIRGEVEEVSFGYEIGAPVNGISTIDTRSSHGSELSPTARHLSKIGVAALAAWMAVTASATNVDASVIPSSSMDPTFVANGSNQSGFILSLQATTAAGIEKVSAFEIDSTHVGTAAHNLVGATTSVDASTIRIGTSPNFNDPSEGVVVGATSYVIDPDYVRGSSAASTPDLAVITLATPLPDMHAVISLTAPAVNQMVEYGGYGFSTPVNGTPTQDGNSRAWFMPTEDSAAGGANNLYYDSGVFSPAFYSQMNANALGGDSGGPVFNSSSGVITIYGELVAQDGGTGSSGDSTFLNFAEPDVHNFIISSVPEPGTGSIVLACVVGAALMRRSRRTTED
jgi:hypothetical protein